MSKEVQKTRMNCATCNSETDGFIIPDGRYICISCAPNAVVARWDAEWQSIEKERQQTAEFLAKQLEKERREKERQGQDRERRAADDIKNKEKARQKFIQSSKPPEPEMAGWSTSASIGQVFLVLFTLNHRSPVTNFLQFAFPVLIRAIWFGWSWICIICSVGTAIWLPFKALEEGRARYLSNKTIKDEERRRHFAEIYSKSEHLIELVSGHDFIDSGKLNDSKLLALKKAIRDTTGVYDVLFGDKSARSVLGTAGYNPIESLTENISRVTVGDEHRLLVKFSSGGDNASRWVAVLWENRTFVADDPTSTLLISALAVSVVQLILLIPVLLLIRLLCETGILWFRFIDEIVSIHNTIKKKGEMGDGQ